MSGGVQSRGHRDEPRWLFVLAGLHCVCVPNVGEISSHHGTPIEWLVCNREAVTAYSRGRSPRNYSPHDLKPRSGDSEPPFTESVADAQRRYTARAVAASRLGRLGAANSVGFTHGYMLPPLRGSEHGNGER